ncbi:MAG: NAD(P)/FAD-dependent oxidoreductase [Kineosporiaceae bacterium]
MSARAASSGARPGPRVVVVGAGPAGLTAGTVLAGRVDGEVLVLDREAQAGGIPRHSDHTGYGVRDLRRVLTGPQYARRLVDRALEAGVVVSTGATVTGWAGERALDVTSPLGRAVVEAGAVVLATGARERPRAARLVAGDRPAGVYTTGMLQNAVHRYGHPVGNRAVVVGAEAVSWSAVLTLRHAHCEPVLMTSRFARPEAFAAFTAAGRLGLGVPVATSTRVVRVVGRRRVEAVEIEHVTTGRRRLVRCDAVVFTGDWVPDSELARTAGLETDGGTRGPLVDTALRTSRPGVFAVGNLVHPVDTADVAALGGRHVAPAVLDWLEGREHRADGVRVRARAPFTWVSPGLLRAGDPGPPRGRFLLWGAEFVRAPRVVVRQHGRVVGAVRVPWPLAPGRVFRLPARALGDVRPGAGDVVVGIER